MPKKQSYISENNTNINNDIASRKEFILFKKSIEDVKELERTKVEDSDKNIIPKFLLPKSNYLELKSYQLLIKNFINPNTPYSRLLLKWQTGSGKTIGAIAIAMNFIKKYQYQEYKTDSKIGSVFIIGFTQNIFINEIMRHPEFGFISQDELDTLNMLKKKAHLGNPRDIEQLKKFSANIKKRLYNRRGNGYFKFIGYKELANHLFLHNKDESMVNETKEHEFWSNLLDMSQKELQDNIDNNTIQINKSLLAEFENSLIICDEIHNTYNTLEKNSWGIAIQIILNYHNTCRALFLSATPLNNSATEVIDLLNLLLPRKYYDNLNKEDFFEKNGDTFTFKTSKENEVVNYLRGRVSFIVNRNDQFIATKEFIGKSIPGIDLLKFIRCPMSPLHYNTYIHTFDDSVSYDQRYLTDLVLPDPDVQTPYGSNAIGLYKSIDIKNKLESASESWKTRYGLHYNLDTGIITGTILKLKNLKSISNKYFTMMTALMNNISKNNGKTFIYHNYIHNSGTLLIQEIMLHNNIIGEFDNSSDNTICSVCGKPRKDHTIEQLNPLLISSETSSKKANDVKSHYYQPVRFAIVHSDLDKNVVQRSLEKFNHINNITGEKIMILIGSRIMKEAHSMNSVRNIFIMARPDNISTLIQIIGRAIRINSHNLLPKHQRHVDISIFTSSTRDKELSYEELKYKEKVYEFKSIQKLEKIMHENAVDGYFNYDIIWNTEFRTDDFELDILPYKLNYDKKILNLDELNLSTFNAYHAKFEVEYCMYIIKRLFIEISSIWKYDDLFNAVKTPPFSVEINAKLVSKSHFNIALNNVLFNLPSSSYIEPEFDDITVKSTALMKKINNPDDKIILTMNDIKHVIVHSGEMYSLVPLHHNEIFIDTEITSRLIPQSKISFTDVSQFLKDDLSADYYNKRNKFINKWKYTNLIDLGQSLQDFSVKFHIIFIEEIVEYVFNIWTQPNQKKREHHAFYIKMLYFYDLQKLIVWASILDDELIKRYKKYIKPAVLQVHDKKYKDLNDKRSLTNTENILITTLNRSDKAWLSTGIIKEFEHSIYESNKLFENVYKKGESVKKVNANLLPIGHYLDNIPRFYDVTGWYDYVVPSRSKTVKENNIIIGFDSRSKASLTVKFKLRSPIKNFNVKDDRSIEFGTHCISKSKTYLRGIAKKIDVDLDTNLNTTDLCETIRNRLIYLEIKERRKPDGIKYFYSVLEDPYV